jgi:hypothetical protein
MAGKQHVTAGFRGNRYAHNKSGNVRNSVFIGSSRCQATTGEDTADWDDLACAVVIFKVYKSVRLLELLVSTSCKGSAVSIISPNPMFRH